VAQVLGVSVNLKHDLTKPEGMKAKLLDSSLANEQFDWKPIYSLEKGVLETYEWFLENEAEKS
jgi:GDP-L-fucose synthase